MPSAIARGTMLMSTAPPRCWRAPCCPSPLQRVERLETPPATATMNPDTKITQWKIMSWRVESRCSSCGPAASASCSCSACTTSSSCSPFSSTSPYIDGDFGVGEAGAAFLLSASSASFGFSFSFLPSPFFSDRLNTIFLKPSRPRTAFHIALRKHHHMM